MTSGTVCVTGATGFIGAHVARLLVERGDRVRVTTRSEARLERLGGLEVEPVKADILDRAAMRRAMRSCDLVVHSAGMVGARPPERVWRVNALAPRLAVEAAAAEGVGRVLVTSSSGAVGIPADGSVGDEREVYRGGLGLTYVDAKHEGEAEALACGARLGVEVVAVNPTYVLGVPVDRSQPGETSTRTIGNYLRGRLPAVVEGATNIVDVEDVAKGHLLAAERGEPGERYLLGGYNMSWVELVDRIAELSGVHHPLVVLPRWIGGAVRAQEALGLPTPIASEAFSLMGQNWRYSSRKARRELGFRTRPLERTLRATIDWYLELIESGAFADEDRSGLDLASAGMRVWERIGGVAGLRAAERYAGRRLVAGA
jgi:dihydroflavonol-4-reductase